MKRILYISLIFNILAIFGAWIILNRLGGWKYALIRLQHQNEGLYFHRAQLFESMPVKSGAVIFLGDSETEQCEWQEMLQDTSVLNRGISGDFSEALLGRLPEILRHRPSKIFLMIGINDLVFGNQPAQIEAVYRQVVQKIRGESPQTRLYLQSVLPVNNAVRLSGVRNRDVEDMNTRIRQIANDFQLPYLDIAAVLKDPEGRLSSQYTLDGMHLNGAGYLQWKTIVEKLTTESALNQ